MLYGPVRDHSCPTGVDGRWDGILMCLDGAPDPGCRLGKHCVATAVLGSRGSVQAHSLVHKLSGCVSKCMWFPFTPNDLVRCW